VVRRGDETSYGHTSEWQRGDEKVLVTTWLEEEMAENCQQHMVRIIGNEKGSCQPHG
jgi:hypothetical protein